MRFHRSFRYVARAGFIVGESLSKSRVPSSLQLLQRIAARRSSTNAIGGANI
jgi:hypothetical protein